VAWVAIVAVGVRVLGEAGALNAPVLAGSAVLVAAVVVIGVLVRGVPLPRPQKWPFSVATVPVLLVAGTALVIAAAAAYLLPVWQGDALGYHLPYVNFALQDGTLADVPAGVAYLSTYPKDVENTFIAWRAMLPDDSLVDLAQLPFGLLGALAITVIAQRQGARTDAALAAGAAWLTLPAVFLQLPTNYVDVASASLALSTIAFLLRPADRTQLMFAALALGLFLGSKPTAPIAALLLFAALAIVAVHGTSMHNTNRLVSSDNKGYASYRFEQAMNGPGSLPGQGPFIAAFGQSNLGDVVRSGVLNCALLFLWGVVF
jgi:hypothetical protein